MPGIHTPLNHNNFSELFHKPEQQTYLLAHSIGLMPKSTESHVNEKFFSHWQQGSEDIWPQWLNAIQEFNSQVAYLFNGDAHQVCPQTNISSGLSKVIGALPAKAGKKIILATEQDFPSTGFVLKQAEKLGYQIRRIEANKDLQDLATWESMLTDDVHSAFITHAVYNNNLLVPVHEIASICRQKSITSIIDVAQSAGVVPIDVKQLNADIILGSSIKWLCGGPGAGYMWLHEQIIDQLEPRDVGWFSHENPFEFDINHFQYANSANRFWGGTPSVMPYVVAANSIQLINQIGVEKIQQYNRRLTQKLLDGLPKSTIQSPRDLTKKGGTLVVRFQSQEQVESLLREQGVLFDSRQLGMRLSPHIYNTEEEIDQLVELIKDSTTQ